MRIFYWIMCFLAIISCFISIKAGDISATIDKATISMLWFIIIRVDELKDCIDILIDRLNETIEEAEKELQNPQKQ